MSLLMTATNTQGVQLTNTQWNTVEKACDMADRLEEVKRKVREHPTSAVETGSYGQLRFLTMSVHA
jgi:U4/U6 small nuclear ribonucleoprotein PRP31